MKVLSSGTSYAYTLSLLITFNILAVSLQTCLVLFISLISRLWRCMIVRIGTFCQQHQNKKKKTEKNKTKTYKASSATIKSQGTMQMYYSTILV